MTKALIPTEMSKGQHDNTKSRKTPPKSSIDSDSGPTYDGQME